MVALNRGRRGACHRPRVILSLPRMPGHISISIATFLFQQYGTEKLIRQEMRGNCVWRILLGSQFRSVTTYPSSHMSKQECLVGRSCVLVHFGCLSSLIHDTPRFQPLFHNIYMHDGCWEAETFIYLFTFSPPHRQVFDADSVISVTRKSKLG